VSLWLVVAGLLPIVALAQDRLSTMPGYADFQKMTCQLSDSVLGATSRAGALSVVWLETSKAFEYTQSGQLYRYDIATKKASPIAASEAQGRAAGRGGRGAGRGGGGGGGGGGRGGGNSACAGGDAAAGRVAGAGRAAGGGRGGVAGDAQAQIAAVGQAQGRGGGAAPARGRQASSAESPDRSHIAFYRDRNLFVSDANGGNEFAITTDGSEKDRIKYGTASWVYGEELRQTSAMWWSPDGKQVAYYRFDESKVPDYFLQMGQTGIYGGVDTEAYPKAGFDNPIVDLFVYDLATKKSTKIDVRDGKPFTNDVVGHYVYDIAWKGAELTLNRTNRRQNIMEYTTCAPATGKCRVIVREAWPTGWVDNHPPKQFLSDSTRFLWTSERNGFANYYMYDWAGTLLTTITNNQFEVSDQPLLVDEKAGVLFYMGRDGDNYMKMQLHRVGLDGKGDMRLTDPAFNHAVTLSPDEKYFVDVMQTHDQPPSTRLVDATGKVVAELATSDLTRFKQLGFRTAEMFTYKATDGKTDLRGTIQFPMNFDPSRKYPVLVPVYGGPAAGQNTASETFALPAATAGYGFLMVNVSSRAAPGMGKRTLDAIYEKLGQIEMDDMAAGITSLASKPYVAMNRIGMYGTSYGGYTSVMSILRHPDVYAAASASSPVTDWRHYDTIYTERYMWLPDSGQNKAGYDAGSAMTYANNLKGRLLLYYGTADNNVHPSNMMQLIRSLQRANKSFDLQVGPDQGHSGVNNARMMEFFIDNLVVRPPAPK
jgi:dipeptidyl-peptidase-4